MGQSVKAVLQLVTGVLAIATLFAWALPLHPDWTVWAARVGFPAGAVALGWGLYRTSRRKEPLPDLLARTAGAYFERDGMCFGFVPAITADKACWMQVFFQNRYDKPCAARIVLRPPGRKLGFGRWPMTTVDVTVECEGAAFGVHRTPWPVPVKLQGRTARFDVACRTEYPDSRGKLMRFREGKRAGLPGGDLGRAAVALGAAAVGALVISRPARWQVSLPKGVTESAPANAAASTEILWRPDIPHGQSPAAPPRACDEQPHV